ncbi:MAG: ATP-binding protein, partial [Planctomycetales bacterium]|nr:ATP-binding protein [Planctomycetales bacterium]
MSSSVDDFAVNIPSETSQGREIQERIIGLLESRSYPDRDLFGVRLALEEALVNAIKHGNGMDP